MTSKKKEVILEIGKVYIFHDLRHRGQCWKVLGYGEGKSLMTSDIPVMSKLSWHLEKYYVAESLNGEFRRNIIRPILEGDVSEYDVKRYDNIAAEWIHHCDSVEHKGEVWNPITNTWSFGFTMT